MKELNSASRTNYEHPLPLKHVTDRDGSWTALKDEDYQAMKDEIERLRAEVASLRTALLNKRPDFDRAMADTHEGEPLLSYEDVKERLK